MSRSPVNCDCLLWFWYKVTQWRKLHCPRSYIVSFTCWFLKADYKDKLIGTFLELNNRTSTILVIYLTCNVLSLPFYKYAYAYLYSQDFRKVAFLKIETFWKSEWDMKNDNFEIFEQKTHTPQHVHLHKFKTVGCS